MSRSRRYRFAAVAVGIGIAAAGHDVAWADTGQSDSAASASHAAAQTKPAKPVKPVVRPDIKKAPKKDKKPAAGTNPVAAAAKPTDLPAIQHHSAAVPAKLPALKTAAAPSAALAPIAGSPTTTAVKSIKTAAAVDASSVTTTTTVKTPAPLSPLAQLAALPGRVINIVLQMFDLTVSHSGPKSPFNWAPIDEALFAAFRGVENFFGLNKAPAKQPVLQTLTYTGPTDDQTPTVAQFLNAASGAYVLGGQPGDLKPFTVNGFQMQTFNPLSGAVGKAWVTPAGQIIIAYQGTTGGTNLLFHPLIAISQFITDLQIMFTNTTPQAFRDSLAFEKRVVAAATKQGYDTSDIFLTGHSLGGWEAQYVAQKTGLGGIGFEGPGLNTKKDGNGANSGFVNVETYGDSAAYFSTDLPGLYPFMPKYVPAGGSKPHYGSIVMIGDPNATNPLMNISKLWGWNPISDIIFAVDMLGNFLEHHLPGMQAYNLGVSPDPGVVPWLGSTAGPVRDWGSLSIGQLQQAASNAGVLIAP